MTTIPKDELKDGAYYINGNDGRGMRIGMWDEKDSLFQCIQVHGIGKPTLYGVPHVDEVGFPIPAWEIRFDPIALIELPEPIIIK